MSDRKLFNTTLTHLERAEYSLNKLMFEWYGTPTFNIIKKEIIKLQKIQTTLKQKEKKIVYI